MYEIDSSRNIILALRKSTNYEIEKFHNTFEFQYNTINKEFYKLFENYSIKNIDYYIFLNKIYNSFNIIQNTYEKIINKKFVENIDFDVDDENILLKQLNKLISKKLIEIINNKGYSKNDKIILYFLHEIKYFLNKINGSSKWGVLSKIIKVENKDKKLEKIHSSKNSNNKTKHFIDHVLKKLDDKIINLSKLPIIIDFLKSQGDFITNYLNLKNEFNNSLIKKDLINSIEKFRNILSKKIDNIFIEIFI